MHGQTLLPASRTGHARLPLYQIKLFVGEREREREGEGEREREGGRERERVMWIDYYFALMIYTSLIRLELGYYNETRSLEPAQHYTPWITIDGEVRETHTHSVK